MLHVLSFLSPSHTHLQGSEFYQPTQCFQVFESASAQCENMYPQ